MSTLAQNTLRTTHDYACECGYGIAVAQPPEICPMCGQSLWRPVAKGRQPILREPKSARVD